MIRNRTLGSKVFDISNIIILAILMLSCFYPLWFTLCVSISYKSAANAGLVTFYPIGFSLASYTEIMGDRLFFNSFWISIQRTGLGTALSLFLTVMMAYPLAKSKREFKARNIFMWILVFCMLFNGGLIPWYLTVQRYRLINSIWALILGGGVPIFNVILVMNFFRNLPKDIEEAAVVDGAGPWRIVVNIPTGVSLTPEQYKKLSELSNKTLNAAKVFIAMIPMLVVYPFIQKYFITGIMLGAVKE